LNVAVVGTGLIGGAVGLAAPRRLRAPRPRVLEALERTGEPRVRELVRLFKGVACLSYYGDDAVMLQLGYDADANVRRGRELRAREGRP